MEKEEGDGEVSNQCMGCVDLEKANTIIVYYR